MSCPNCGAPMKGSECAYCGTPFGEPSLTMAIGKVVNVRFEHGGREYEFDFMLTDVNLDSYVTEPTYLTDFSGDRYVVASSFSQACTARFSGSLVPSDKYGSATFLRRVG